MSRASTRCFTLSGEFPIEVQLIGRWDDVNQLTGRWRAGWSSGSCAVQEQERLLLVGLLQGLERAPLRRQEQVLLQGLAQAQVQGLSRQQERRLLRLLERGPERTLFRGREQSLLRAQAQEPLRQQDRLP